MIPTPQSASNARTAQRDTGDTAQTHRTRSSRAQTSDTAKSSTLVGYGSLGPTEPIWFMLSGQSVRHRWTRRSTGQTERKRRPCICRPSRRRHAAFTIPACLPDRWSVNSLVPSPVRRVPAQCAWKSGGPDDLRPPKQCGSRPDSPTSPFRSPRRSFPARHRIQGGRAAAWGRMCHPSGACPHRPAISTGGDAGERSRGTSLSSTCARDGRGKRASTAGTSCQLVRQRQFAQSRPRWRDQPFAILSDVRCRGRRAP